MTGENFRYELVLDDAASTVTSVMAYQRPLGSGLRGVLWSVPGKQWIYAPAVVSDILFEETDPMPTRSVDRATAEAAARDSLGSELPSESALIELCEVGERMGWRFGPPGS